MFETALRHLAASLAIALVLPLAVQAQPVDDDPRGRLQRFASACRDDMATLCAGVPPGGGRILACLRDQGAELSGRCRASMGEAPARPRGPARAEAARTGVLRDIAYGADPAQRLDVYLPPSPRRAPVIVMLHGGAWAFGDKAAGPVVDAKVRHWVRRGYVFVSVNTRLLPRADPVAQARDLAAAVATVRALSASWGADRDRLVLMGHSSGAHVAALLAADPSLAAEGAASWLGTVAIDSAAYDVPAIMAAPHPPLYDRAFGQNEAGWAAASPLHRLRPGAKPMLLVCSSLRENACPQARRFAQALGSPSAVAPVALGHGALNAALGTAPAYTARVDRFLRDLGLP